VQCRVERRGQLGLDRGQRSKRFVQARSSKRIELSSKALKTAWGAGACMICGCARATASSTSTTLSGALP